MALTPPCGVERQDLALRRRPSACRARRACAGSSSPTRRRPARPRGCPRRASAAARLAVTVDLPTPPLPEPTQITFLTARARPRGGRRGRASAGGPASPRAERTSKPTLTAATPSSARTRLRDGLLEVGADRAAGGGQRDDHVDARRRRGCRSSAPSRARRCAPQLGVDDRAERVADLVVGGHRHDSGKRGTPSKKNRRGPRAPPSRGRRDLLHCRLRPAASPPRRLSSDAAERLGERPCGVAGTSSKPVWTLTAPLAKSRRGPHDRLLT